MAVSIHAWYVAMQGSLAMHQCIVAVERSTHSVEDGLLIVDFGSLSL